MSPAAQISVIAPESNVLPAGAGTMTESSKLEPKSVSSTYVAQLQGDGVAVPVGVGVPGGCVGVDVEVSVGVGVSETRVAVGVDVSPAPYLKGNG